MTVPPIPAPRELRPGSRLDRYVVEAVLGKGGMGIVYAAHDTALARPVAVKIIRPDFDRAPEDARARLLREARAMARLTHANVVTVHDVGMFEDQLFVAMEFVDGMTLKRWLQEAPRSWREIVAAFVQAGRGLEAAHAVDLVHRDFKPENVLFGSDGRVRVTDFGVAHLASESSEPARRDDPGHAAASLFSRITGTGLHFGTPAYMSPEQLLEQPTDARTDQFSFCVALYEALYGQAPFGGESIAEHMQSVVAGAVRPPGRSKVPKRVGRTILRGLSRAPDDRYPSMRELLAELEDALSSQRRRTALMFVGVGVAVLAVVAARIERVQPCSGAAGRLAAEWSPEVRGAVTAALMASGSAYAAESATRTTSALDDYAAAWRASSTESCLSTHRHEQSQALLDLRAACLNERLDELGALVRVLRSDAATIAARSVSAAQSLTPVSTCGPGKLLQTEHLPGSRDKREQIARVRTQVAEAKAYANAGLYPQSFERAEHAVTAAGSTGYPPAVAEAVLQKGLSEHDLGRSLAAAATLTSAIAAAERAGLDELRALAAVELVRAYTHVSRLDDAEKAAAVAEAILDRLHHPPLLEADRLNAFCVMRLSQERFAEATAHCARALALLQQLPTPPPDRLARAYSNLGNAELRVGTADAAIDHEKKALEILERWIGPNNTNVAEQLDEVGGMLTFVGRFAEAEALQARGLAIAEKVLGADQPALGVMLANYATTLTHLKRLAEAEKYQRRAVRIFEQNEPYPGYRAQVLLGLGEILVDAGELDQAQVELEKTVALGEKSNGADSSIASSARRVLGDIARRRGKFAEAITLHERSLASIAKVYGKAHPDVAAGMRAIGEDYLAGKDSARALERFTRALAIDEALTDSSGAAKVALDRQGIEKARALASRR